MTTISPIERAETDAMYAMLLEERALNGSENDEFAWDKFQDEVDIERFKRAAQHPMLSFPLTDTTQRFFERMLVAPPTSTPRLNNLLSRGCPFSN